MVTAPYRTHGYLDARIVSVPVLDRAAHTVDYSATVEPGAVYHMGKLMLVNLSAAQKAEVMPYWQMKQGDVFNADLIAKFIAATTSRALNNCNRSAAGASTRGGMKTGMRRAVDVVLTFTPPRQ